MNPNFNPRGFPQPIQQGQMMMPPNQMMTQGQFMNPSQGHFGGQNQGQMAMGPQGFNANMMGMQMRPNIAPPTYNQTVNQRPQGVQGYGQRPGMAPPSYNQALNQSYQRPRNSGPGQNNRNAGKTEDQIQKEKYFQQQQAKLKQFGKTTSGPTLDPNKLVDSIFGGQPSAKPKPKVTEAVKSQPATIETDDGFGAFLSSPESMAPPPTLMNPPQETTNTSPQLNNINTVTQSVAMTTQTQVTTEKKDLTAMMFDSCDLSAPQKAKSFHKPSLKEINPVHVVAPVHHTSQSARRWDRSEELSDLFVQEDVSTTAKDETTLPKKPVKHVSPTSKHPPKPPPWLGDDLLIPPLYKQVLEACVVDGQISTERLYPILVLSGLPKELLGQLWTLCNQTSPGQLVVKELYQLLAVIALTQNNFKVESLDILRRCPQAPVPFLAPAGTAAQAPQQVVIMPQSPQSPPGIPVTGPFHGQIPAQSVAQIPVGQPQPLAAPGQGQVMQNQAENMAASFNQPHSGSLPSHVTGIQATSMISPMTSSPATLPVTQLPPAGISSGIVGNVVNMAAEEDDFADFQSASAPSQNIASVGDLVKDTKENIQPPVKDPSKFLYSENTSALSKSNVESLGSQDLKHSTVENFFGSDSSEMSSTSTLSRPTKATSPDDEYFDGYKSADSKPSDSTSQFSTDQSEGEDFKNFENYLDEFQRKKDLQDKESPLHRPISKFLNKDNTPPSPSHFFKNPTTPVKKLPIPVQVKLPANQKTVSSDEFSDFADFQSAPIVSADNQSDPLKATPSAIDLIGDEDKYAALRTLDFSSPPENEPDLMGEPVSETDIKPPTDSDDNWADFQTASGDKDQPKTESGEDSQASNQNIDSKVETVFQSLPDTNEDSNWAAFETANDENNTGSGWSLPATEPSNLFGNMSTDKSNDLISETSAGLDINVGTVNKNHSEDWAGFQAGTDDFSDFQSSVKDDIPKTDDKSSGLVNVKKDRLETNEILGLFKVKSEPVSLKSRDDDTTFPMRPDLSVSSNVNRMHGISDTPPKQESLSPTEKTKQKHFSEEDDFMKPPPMDDFGDDDHDEFGGYSRGYDFDDIMKPNVPEKKNVYGVYGVNEAFVVEGHKRNTGDPKNIAIEVTKDSDGDSDSVSSKDNDVFRGKFGLGKGVGEDSQSIASLELVVNRSLQNVRDAAEGGDTQSVSSNDFGNFEAGVNNEVLPESKSLDSLDLRREETAETGSSQESSDKESKEESPQTDHQDFVKPVFDVGVPTSGLPIIGDRYSAIMHDVPGSDKHAYEWQRCLYNCCRMIQDANNIFNSISSSNVCNEVIKSSQGSQYIQGVIEIYRVVCKIIVTMKKTGIHSDKLSQLLKDIDLAWNNLTAFLVGGSVMPDSQSLDFSSGYLLDDDQSSRYRSCGVCLLDVEMKMKGVDNENDNAKLTYSGRQYHAACANFWINCVDSTLPALKLPELL